MPTGTYFDRRYQVFISSTYTDLREERRGVMQAVLEMDCFPAGMELFPAADDTAWEYIRKVIEESDYYIVVIGARYGSRDDSGLSFTEREYDYAVELGKPALAFLHSDPSLIPIGKADLSENDRAALEAFRAKVKRKLCDHWSTSDELRAKVLASINRLKKSHPSGGWVRAGEIPAAQLELDLERARRELAETRAELKLYEEKAQQEAQAALLPPAKGWGNTTNVTVEITNAEKQLRTQPLTITWDDIFKCLGPRLAEGGLSSASLRNQLLKCVAKQVVLSDGEKAVFPQEHADRIAWQLQALKVIELGNYSRWKLTTEGWQELDSLLVEEEEPKSSEEENRPE